jgi:hypothetical protein
VTLRDAAPLGGASPSNRDEHLSRKAVELVRAAYDVADRMRKVDLDAVNEPRPPTLRYHAQYELVREFIERANAMREFAGRLGLIDSNEEAAIVRDHPDLWQWMETEDQRLSSGSSSE